MVKRCVCLFEKALDHTVLSAGGELLQVLGFPCCPSGLQTGFSPRRRTTSL
jgi:hypothetical protein